MAILILGKTECSICGGTLNEGDDIVATTHFIHDQDHHLWRFSDSGIHRDCFLTWEHRAEFVTLYNDTLGTVSWGNGKRHHMSDSGDVSLVD